MVEKINELKKELNKSEEKNKSYEEKIQILQTEMIKEKIKYKDLEEKIELKKKSKEKLEKNSKENLYEIIFEKDNEIKQLKTKIENFPIDIKEGEELISIIFRSLEEDINFSVICKNTDKFYKIENELYEVFPEFYETNNIFTAKGKKINKSKSLFVIMK